ncbi:zinc-binding dehydrogenase [Saccharopolyspora sp. NFXS83]|uniref:zinc-dependent alcohol dehydrogenase family protein n=1 Tax=Saccharopolyspora sp. NFXS83 TaxID=2993560 RepID=UPI00224A8188|nr:zinc-binding dehydrogenase [Saccharopolyspora sp. NFXS83]MCX2730619.1 zinc-binding dehydrogenase [Saccharopolyspora sp. NFXS83]
MDTNTGTNTSDASFASAVPTAMTGAFLPGDGTVELRETPLPRPGPGQVLLRVRASGICGSDIHYIYNGHVGEGGAAYRGVVAGHEPAGEVVHTGPGCERLRAGDRVAVYHISGCGQCDECSRGYFIGCTSESRAAYGWQRDGGHAPYLIADERTCVLLPEPLTFVDGAFIACGIGTVYEALTRIAVNGADRLLVTGLGPVGAAAALVARALGVRTVYGAEVVPERMEWARGLDLFDAVLDSRDRPLEEIDRLTAGTGVEAAVDCSGHPAARTTALKALRVRGRLALVGEGGQMTLDVSDDVLHKQVLISGSWVTSVHGMTQLAELLARQNLHPDRLVAERFPQSQAGRAYEAAAGRAAGKVCLVFD